MRNYSPTKAVSVINISPQRTGPNDVAAPQRNRWCSTTRNTDRRQRCPRHTRLLCRNWSWTNYLIGDFNRPGFPHALNLRKRKWPAGVAILLDPVKVRSSRNFSFSSAVWTIRLSNGDRLAAGRAFVRHFHFLIHFRGIYHFVIAVWSTKAAQLGCIETILGNHR